MFVGGIFGAGLLIQTGIPPVWEFPHTAIAAAGEGGGGLSK